MTTTSNYSADVRVEVAFDSGVKTGESERTWTDVSDYVEFAEGIGISGGRSDERTQAENNTMSLVVDNSDGRFTPGYAAGAYYPDVRIGRPIRVLTQYPTDLVANLLTANKASAETTNEWSGNTLFGTYPDLPSSVAQSATRAQAGTKSTLITWPTTTAGSAAVLASGQVLTVGQQYVASTYVWVPTGSPDVRLGVAFRTSGAYTSTKDAWVRLEVYFTAMTTAMFFVVQAASATSGNQCWVDASMLHEGTTAVDFTTGTSSTPTERVRFAGFIDEWPQEWPDQVDDYSRSVVTASSRLARLSGGSALNSQVVGATLRVGPSAYYQLGSAEGASTAADSSGNDARALRVTGSGTKVVFGTAEGLTTDSIKAARFKCQSVVGSGKFLTGGNPSYVALSDGATIMCFYQQTAGVTVQAGVMFGNGLSLQVNGGNLYGLRGNNAVTFVTSELASGIDDGEVHHLAVSWDSALNATLYIDGAAVDTNTGGGTFQDDTGVRLNLTLAAGIATATSTETYDLAHAAIFATAVSAADILDIATAGLTGYDQGAAWVTIQRFMSYAGLDTATSAASIVASQPIAFFNTDGLSPIDSIRKVEATEGGVLYDTRGGSTFYKSRNNRLAATPAVTLSFDDGEIGAAVAPKHDRLGMVNMANATYVGGTVDVTDEDSRDIYGDSAVSLELATSDSIQAEAAAWWQVNQYAEPSTRIPTLPVVDLTQLDTTKLAGVLRLDVGSLVSTTGWPTQAAASTQQFFVEGYTESLGLETHTVTLNVTPAEPWLNIFTLQDATKGEIDDIYRLAW